MQLKDKKNENGINYNKIIKLKVKEAKTSYFRMRTHKVGEHFKKWV